MQRYIRSLEDDKAGHSSSSEEEEMNEDDDANSLKDFVVDDNEDNSEQNEPPSSPEAVIRKRPKVLKKRKRIVLDLDSDTESESESVPACRPLVEVTAVNVASGKNAVEHTLQAKRDPLNLCATRPAPCKSCLGWQPTSYYARNDDKVTYFELRSVCLACFTVTSL